jgi:predicted ATPase/DNA-binding winged helix-turn-helix (wHTH) protein
MDDDPSYAFGSFVLHVRRRQLLQDGVLVPLGTRVMDILLLLIARHGAVVTKREIFAAIWPNRIVEENNLTVHVSALRRALRDGRDGVRYVQTLSGRGYSFVAPLSVMEAGPRRNLQRVIAARSDNLPAATTRFIGRADEMDQVSKRLAQHRLVTVAGVGGIGKTRLAVQVGHRVAANYKDGVWLLDVAGLADPSQIADSLGANAVERLVGFLRDLNLLLILDNCDPMIIPAAACAGAILAGSPNVSILATSRESLAITGESIYRLPPLPFPAETGDIRVQDALAHDSVRLLVDRARDIDGSFTLDDGNVQAVVRICSRLDGIALAIEMAAPRLLVLKPAQLADRLNERFRLLTGHDRGALPRHRTLRAMIDWSYESLGQAESLLLRRLSVFAGGATLAAVVAVVSDGADFATEDWVALELLASLVNKSLVVSDVSGTEPRYRLLETIRHYAREKLAESGELSIQALHAQYFAGFFEQAEAAWPSAVTASWLKIYGQDTDNLRAALDWAFGPGGDADLALRLVAASYPLWWDLPELPLHESRRWFDLAVARITPATPSAVAARVWFGSSWRDVRFGDRENFPAAAQAVALFRGGGNTLGLGAALWRAGSALLTAETADEAAAYFSEAEQILRRQGPTKWLALCMVKQGDLRFRLGALDGALAAYEEAMRLTRTTGNWYGLMNGGSNMAELLFHMGQRDAALAQLRQLRDELLPGRRTPLVATMVAHLLLAGHTREARASAREAVVYARAVGLPAALAWTVEALALLLVEEGAFDEAGRLAGYARGVHPSVATRAGSRRAVYQLLETRLSQGLSPSKRVRLAAEGQSWTEAAAAEAALEASRAVA